MYLQAVTLYTQLQAARSEEDVKDAYIKALGLRGYTKGLIDIQSKEIWFEAKDTGKNSSYAMFTQLLHYVQDALNKGESVPPFLVVIDTEKAALMKSADVIPFLAKKTIKWGKSASQYTQEALDEISAHTGTHFVSFKMATHEDEFIHTVKAAIKTGDIIRTQITPDNLKQVFDKWVAMVGREITGVAEEDYALLFFADIMNDGTVSTHTHLPAELLHKNGKPVFTLNGRNFELGNKEGYRQFWTIYHRPPKSEYRDYLLERRDSLIPLDERSFKGAYYTPLHVVDKADIDVMKATKTCVAAQRFQYDYLNDDITDDCQIDYSLSNKVPTSLRKAIAEGKKILVLINPPYAEVGTRGNTEAKLGTENKEGVSKTKFAATSMKNYGKASNELFTQFVARIAQEIPSATLAMFSTLKYINAPNFEKFRDVWNASYQGGFVIHNKAFDGLNGQFPIGFLIWQTGIQPKISISKIVTEVLDRDAKEIGEKYFFNLPNKTYLNVWLTRPKTNKLEALPLKNGITPATSNPRVKTWTTDGIGYMYCGKNDLQHAEQQTVLFSSVYGQGDGFYLTHSNLWQSAIVFAMRRAIRPNWLNDRDQFLQPTEPLTEEFKNDCLIWMLFNRCNRTASANNLEWNGKKWSIVNHFIPYTEDEVDAPDRFESDFMVQYLADKSLSTEATAVLDAGRVLWKTYFSHTDARTVRETYKLNRADVGWYQIRNALAERNKSGDTAPVNFITMEAAYAALTDKLRPMVFSLGFLR